MKIGIYFAPAKNAGGVYQYSITLLESLVKIPGNEYIVFGASKDILTYIHKDKNIRIINQPIASHGTTPKIKNYVSYLFTYFTFHFLSNPILTTLYRFAQKENIEDIEKENLDLIFYSTPSNLSFLAKVPSVVPINDLMHRVHPEFLEVSTGGRYENREFVYRNISKKAFRILVDSEVGKKDVEKYYKTDSSKIVILPFLPPSYLDNKMPLKTAQKICSYLKLPDKFIFYPAKFWPHKNHANLIEAMKILKLQGITVNLVLTGSKNADFSSFSKIFSLIKKYNLEKQVFYLGFVNDRQISAIYKAAKAMVMPTYFGPTNIPVLEAWTMGTPVIYSDVRGCREQLGNAGLLVNPGSPNDVADKIVKIYTLPKLASELARKGKIRIKRWTFKDFSNKIEKIINEYDKKAQEINKNRVIFEQ